MNNWSENTLKGFKIRPYSFSDKGYVLSLWEKAFLKQMPSELWDWKYASNAYPSPKVVCAKETGELIVFYGGVSYSARNNAGNCRMVQLMDIMSHPNYRKTGLFIQTAEFYIQMIEGDEQTLFLYGFPGEYHLKIGEKYLGYKALTKKVEYLRAEINCVPKNSFSSSGKLEKIEQVDPSFDLIWENCETHYPLSVIRNSKFIQWRFIEHPAHNYDIWVFKNKEGHPAGYAVALGDGKKVSIVDMLFPEDDGSIEEFFNQFGDYYRLKNFSWFEIWLPESHFISTALQRTGFKASPEPKGFIPTIRPLQNTPSLSWVSENLFYTMADGDLM